MGKEDRGFASMDPAKQRQISSKGGRAAHVKGTGHEWSSEEAREAGHKGGLANRRRLQEQMVGQQGASEAPFEPVDVVNVRSAGENSNARPQDD